MDVRCSSCGEPWDIYHLAHDAIHDTSLEESEIAAWRDLQTAQRLACPYRERFREAGWQFGRSLLHVRRCPCCPPDAEPDPERDAIKSALCDTLGGDDDAIAAAFDELDL